MLVAVGVGGAAAQALEPDFIDIRQNSWKDNQNLVLDPELLAQLVAQGGVDLSTGAAQAAYSGISPERFDDLVYMEQQVPAAAQLMFLWRYGKIVESEWRFGMQKLGFRPDFIDRIALTFSVPLTAEEVAVMVQRGVLPNEGQLPVGPPTTVGLVPPMPVVNLSAYDSAQAYGLTHEQLDALTRIIGLPASPDLAARMVFRGIIDRIDFDRAIAEGNTRNEWAPFLFDGFRQILTAGQYAELQLRGYTDKATRRANTAKHGLSTEDSDLLYDVLGRAVNVKQVTTGLARGGTYPGSYANVPSPYKEAIQRSNVREEYSELAYANRYNYPSPFVLRSLAEAGDLGDAAAVQQLLEEIGWKPSLAAKVSLKWVPAGTAKLDPFVKKAETTLFTEAHKAYVKTGISVAQVTPAFTALNIPADAQLEIVALLDVERTLQSDVPPPPA
jgi:hypothetical protein